MSQHFNAPVAYSVNGAECPEDSDDEDSIYVISDFEGETFKRLCDCYCRIVAPPAVIWAGTQGEVSYQLADFIVIVIAFTLGNKVILCNERNVALCRFLRERYFVILFA